MANYRNYLVNIFATVGLAISLLVIIFFSQDTSIKIDKAYALSKRVIGFGDDYVAFTANSFDDYLDIAIRGIKYKLGLNSKNYHTVDLIADMSAMSDLNHQRIDRSKRRWVRANLKVEDGSERKTLYKVKVRSKGDRALHVSSFDTMSFKVDIRGSKRLQGMEEFSIQRPIIRNYGWEILINRIGSKLGLMAPQVTPVNFYFNGDDRGIYLIEEGFGSEFLERRGRKTGPIFSLNEPMGERFPDVVYEAYESKKVDSGSEIIYDNARIKLLELKKIYQEEDFSPSTYFDLKKWASYFSVIDLFGSYHGAVPKSVKLYFNPSTQLFEPIFFDNHMGGRGYVNFSLMDFKYLKDYSQCGMACQYPEWFSLFYKNQDFFNLYTETLELLISKYKKGFFDDLIEDVELFNNAMYSTFSPSDRVFYSGIFPYYFDIGHLDKRAKMLRHKLEEYVGLSYKKNTTYTYKDAFGDKFFEKTILSDLPFINRYCRSLNMDKCSNKDLKFIRKHNFTLTEESYQIPDNSVLFLGGHTVFNNSVISGSGDSSMIVQIGGKVSLKNAKFDSLSNVSVAGTNWSGAINIVESDVILDNVSISHSNGEDALNLVDSKVQSYGGITFKNVAEDALDGDSISLSFDNITCVDIGNDCLDTSNSFIKGGNIAGKNIGDKLVSFGEGTKATLGVVDCEKCGIGIAVKDSSFAEVDSILFKNTPLELAVFQKKRFFNPAELVIHASTSFDKRRLIGKNCSVTENGLKVIGSMNSKDVKEMMYGNEYGRASNR